MTSRLKSWLNDLDRKEEVIAALPPRRQYGKLVRATGLVMEAIGLKLPIGTLCLVECERSDGQQYVESEVVGFNGQTLFFDAARKC